MAVTPSSDLPMDLKPLDGIPRHGGWLFRRRYLLVLLIPVFMFLGGVLGMYFQPVPIQKFYALTGLQPGAGSNSPIALPPNVELPAQMAETMLPTDVVGLARVMPRGDVSFVAAPHGAGDARLSELLVSVGDRVERGAPVARLDNHDTLESAVLLAEANLAVRQATLVQTRSAVQSSRDEAQATLDQALANFREAESNLERTEKLADRGVATGSTLDTARAAALDAGLTVARAEATLARFSSIDLGEQPDVVVASRNVAAAEADLARVKLDTGRALVVAPIAGTILEIQARPGERPPVEGIMKIGDISVMMAEVEIYQDRIGSVKPGQPVELVADALGRTLRGTVESIGLMVGRQGLVSKDAAANTDARVIRIIVTLDASSTELASSYTNLEVIARIDTSAETRASR